MFVLDYSCLLRLISRTFVNRLFTLLFVYVMLKVRRLITDFARNVRACHNKSSMDPRGKTVLITGGARGIGRAAVEEFLCAESSPVIFFDCNLKESCALLASLQKKYGEEKVKFVPGDVTRQEDVENAFQVAGGCPDVLICSAALSDDVHWARSVDVTVSGCIITVLTALKYMQPGSTVIIRSSSCSFTKPILTVPVYVTNKHAVTGFGINMGHPFYFDSTGIRIIVLCPGLTAGHSLDNFHNLIYKKEWIERSMAVLKVAPQQPPEACSKAMLYLLQNAPHGSVWAVDNSTLWLIDIPDRTCYSEFIQDLSEDC